MSLSLTMIASSNVGLRSCRFAEVATASAIRPHCDGVQAGVCQRIFSLTAQIVCLRQEGPWVSGPLSIGDPWPAETCPAGSSWPVGAGVATAEAALAWGAATRLASAAAVPKDKGSFRKSASTSPPPVRFDGADFNGRLPDLRAVALKRVWPLERFDPHPP